MPRKYSLSGAQIRGLRPKKRLSGALFSLSLSAVASAVPLCATVVSKKVAQRATTRNLIKRRCKHALSRHLSSLTPGIAYVLTARREAAGASYADVVHDIETLIAKTAEK